MKATFTVVNSHGYVLERVREPVELLADDAFVVGELVRLTRPDMRWWMRLWRRITFRPAPTISETARLTAVSGRVLTVQ